MARPETVPFEGVDPEAHVGGPLAVVQDGDRITIDAVEKELTLEISADDLAARLADFEIPGPKVERGLLAKYAHLVSSASLGAVTDPN